MQDRAATPSNGHRELHGVASVIEGIIQIAEQVAIEDIEAVAAELERIEQTPPLLPIRGVPSLGQAIPGYRAMVNSFLSFRRSLERAEASL